MEFRRKTLVLTTKRKVKTMKKRKGLVCLLLCVSLVVSGFSFGFAADTDTETTYMQEVVETLGAHVDGQDMFDYLSYVYLGWRTTGGRWQNQVIDSFVHEQLVKAGYTDAGSGFTDSTSKSENDKSSSTDDDYAWVTYFSDVSSLVWDPEYAKLTISAEGDFEGKDALIDRINVESYSFNPTTDTYLDYYGMDSIDDMWKWITEKDADGNRVNVLNGKEAKLNKRVHLAWNSCFTEPAGTNPEEATGVTGEIVYIGTVPRSGDSCSEVTDLTQLQGKVLLSDSSLSYTFALAQEVGAVAVMSKASLNPYSTPKDENGNIISPFDQSARYASGANLGTTSAQTETGAPIVEWQLSNDQYNALKELLEKSEEPVMAQNISIGDTYEMNNNDYGSKGQAIAIAEIKGSTYPDERVFLCAHVQEPCSNDNATGVATLLGMATEMKKMIDEGTLERPERTITFMWGDEMQMATCYMNSHSEEKANIVAVLDLDMTGEDPEKTGGTMRIEKTPDPSAVYNYTLDTLPWEDGEAYDESFADSDGNFVRLPDSHTLWGAGSIKGMFQEGFYLNDLYMYATQNVIQHHDGTFQVEVCPYEGGSDHSRFLAQNIPALLTWHFTDYTYHSSVDTLAMSSAREMENVGITSLAAALMMANTTDDNEELAIEMLNEVRNAALERFEIEQQNTLNHQVYTKANGGDYAAALENEKEVLNAWGEWYQEAYLSVEKSLLTKPSAEYKAIRAIYQLELEFRLDEAVAFAEEMIAEEPQHTELVNVPATDATEDEYGNIEYWYCEYCGKYYADAEATQEITLEDILVEFVPEDPDNPGVDPEDPIDPDDELGPTDNTGAPTAPADPTDPAEPVSGTGDNLGFAAWMTIVFGAGIGVLTVMKKRREDEVA